MSELSGMRLEQLLSIIEIMRAEMVPEGMAEGMLAAHIAGAMEAYDAEQDAYERYIHQASAAAANGVGTHQG